MTFQDYLYEKALDDNPYMQDDVDIWEEWLCDQDPYTLIDHAEAWHKKEVGK